MKIKLFTLGGLQRFKFEPYLLKSVRIYQVVWGILAAPHQTEMWNSNCLYLKVPYWPKKGMSAEFKMMHAVLDGQVSPWHCRQPFYDFSVYCDSRFYISQNHLNSFRCANEKNTCEMWTADSQMQFHRTFWASNWKLPIWGYRLSQTIDPLKRFLNVIAGSQLSHGEPSAWVGVFSSFLPELDRLTVAKLY